MSVFTCASRRAVSFFCASWLVIAGTLLLAGGMSAFGPLQAKAQETDSGDTSMVVSRIGLIDLDGVIRSSTGTAKVRELLDIQLSLIHI